MSALTVDEARRTFSELQLKGAAKQIAAEVLKEIRNRLDFLASVGLGYLSLARAGPTLSGGEVFEAGDPTALDTVFRRIDEMQVAKIEKVAGEELDDFRPWAWVGLGLLGAFALLGFFLRVTPW